MRATSSRCRRVLIVHLVTGRDAVRTALIFLSSTHFVSGIYCVAKLHLSAEHSNEQEQQVPTYNECYGPQSMAVNPLHVNNKSFETQDPALPRPQSFDVCPNLFNSSAPDTPRTPCLEQDFLGNGGGMPRHALNREP